MATRTFTQSPYQYGNGQRGFTLMQTRNGVEEAIQPVAFWEYDTASGLYMPPGQSTNPAMPRVASPDIGAKADTAVTDPTLSASEIALLKGLLKQLQGTGTGAAPVTLSGSTVTKRTVTTAPLAAGGWFSDSATFNATTDRAESIGLLLKADTVTRVLWEEGDENYPNRVGVDVVIPPNVWSLVGPFRPRMTQGHWRLINPTSSAQTALSAYELKWLREYDKPVNLFALLVYKLKIRDTVGHTWTSDPGYVFQFNRSILGGGKVPFYVVNTHNQAVTIGIQISPSGNPGGVSMGVNLGSKIIPAASNVVITNADFPGIDVPSEVIYCTSTCSTAPTSGDLTVGVDNTVGGTV